MRYRVYEMRQARGISQTELARISGVSRATIWMMEKKSGKVTTTKTLFKLATALGVEMDELLVQETA